MTPPLPLPQARRRKTSSLPIALGLLTLMVLVVLTAFFKLGKSLEYFVTPTEYLQQKDNLGSRPLRIGGLAKAVQYSPQTLELRFSVTDGSASFPVYYQGAVSDLFKENQGIVVRGEFKDETFYASELIVKHSERYQVPQTQTELKDLLRHTR